MGHEWSLWKIRILAVCWVVCMTIIYSKQYSLCPQILQLPGGSDASQQFLDRICSPMFIIPTWGFTDLDPDKFCSIGWPNHNFGDFRVGSLKWHMIHHSPPLQTLSAYMYRYSLIRTFAHYYRTYANFSIFLFRIELFIIHLIFLCSRLKQNRDGEGT